MTVKLFILFCLTVVTGPQPTPAYLHLRISLFPSSFIIFSFLISSFAVVSNELCPEMFYNYKCLDKFVLEQGFTDFL
jgi:hypothetical protein